MIAMLMILALYPLGIWSNDDDDDDDDDECLYSILKLNGFEVY